jgi:aryl-alcohol dehydrogenase-like predicted oxidoreductase
MIYRPFGRLAWPVSAIGLGTWNLGNQWGFVSDEDAYATVRAALDAGINLVDTADAYGLPYGLSEERVGRALGHRRHEVILVSKCGNWGRRDGKPVAMDTPDKVRLCAHASLGRLGSDYLDVLLCHEGGIADPGVYLEGFEQLVAEGRVRAYGISTDNLDVLKRFNAAGHCAVVEVHYNLLDRGAESELLPYCAEHGIAVLLRGPLAMGLLSGRYAKDHQFADSVRAGWHKDAGRQADFERRVAQVERLAERMARGEAMISAALGYVISHPAAPVAIPGAKSPEQARVNAAAGARLLEEAGRAALVAAVD